ncbi:MAG: ETX/MTX2 family pore-forming toxin [Spiroplasma ixodetis]|nr:ETX/MTX2 family pore-forming toxin [Spiroplasma ixodetis]
MIKNMRKLLSLMSILGFSTVTVTNVVACTSADTSIKHETKKNGLTWYPPDNMENIIKDINNTIIPKNGWVADGNYEIPISMKDLIQKEYDKYFTGKEGTLKPIKTVAKDENIVDSFQDIYTNSSNTEQIYQTQSQSKTITNTNTFSWKTLEKIGVKVKAEFKIPWVGKSDVETSAEFGSEQQGTKTTTDSETLTNTSQSFKLKSHSIGTVLYTIKQGTYHNEGKISYPVNLTDTISSSYYWSQTGQWSKSEYTIKDLIKLLVDNGYKEQLKIGSNTYSIISTDNPDNPKTVFFNSIVTIEMFFSIAI